MRPGDSHLYLTKMSGLKCVKCLLWTAKVFLLIAAVFQILSVAAPFWSNNGVNYVGLWKYGRCVYPNKNCFRIWHVEYFVSGLIAAAVFQILALGSASWAYNTEASVYVGLWRNGRCFKSDYRECYKTDHVEYFAEDWLKAVRGLSCLGIIFLSFPLVILPVYMYTALGLYYRCMLGTMSLSSLLSAACCLAGVVVYGIQIMALDWDTSWCLYVAIVGAAAAFIAFLILAIATITKRPDEVRTTEKLHTIYA